tara:strand:+ start:2397 stop:2783 length:387 start_codon:yes stop_codon:yes gene_type:complete
MKLKETTSSAKAPKEVKYTQEETDYIVEEYNKSPNRETVDRLADKLGKKPRSVIGKLAKEGVYKSQSYTPKYGDKPASKEDIVSNIEEGFDAVGKLAGLEKAQKGALLTLEKFLKEEGIIEELSAKGS